MCCQTPVDDILNDFESVNFIQCEKLRCESRHGNPYLIIHAGHLNLAIIGHYNFATTTYVKAQLKCPLSSSIKMTTLISHSLY
ncbi:hypothetical protein CSB66_4845 [Enterobacter hormaechei]|nr:hypothetical protein CSB66_4845 [Enterobacter hormaechei]